jgi:hypothetical protein
MLKVQVFFLLKVFIEKGRLRVAQTSDYLHPSKQAFGAGL